MTDLVRARHKVSGQIAEVPESFLRHDTLGQYLEEVGPEAKPYLPEMHRVSLPAKPTEEQVEIALAAGVIEADEAKEIKVAPTNKDKS